VCDARELCVYSIIVAGNIQWDIYLVEVLCTGRFRGACCSLQDDEDNKHSVVPYSFCSCRCGIRGDVKSSSWTTLASIANFEKIST
jgi:hypothetical protein